MGNGRGVPLVPDDFEKLSSSLNHSLTVRHECFHMVTHFSVLGFFTANRHTSTFIKLDAVSINYQFNVT